MKHTDLEPDQRQRPPGPATPQPVSEPAEWVPHAPGVERNIKTGCLRTVPRDDPSRD